MSSKIKVKGLKLDGIRKHSFDIETKWRK